MSSHDTGIASPVTPRRECATATATPVVSGPCESKIHSWHLDRLAMVYIRQSTTYQVLNHRESRERQYALADHAVALGWPRERVVVVDDDQARTGRTAEARSGFHRLLAEVTMEHVGVILGIEMSRIARNNRDWHNLLEMCAVVGTILSDEDRLYDPNDPSDRLLLGLGGLMSEYEAIIMRNRLERGRLNKARRGELFQRVPFGYVKVPSGGVALDPDEQARQVVHLIFDKFDELGSIYGLLHYLVRHDIRLGMRLQDGPQRGQLVWRRPALPTLNNLLHHPMYAGAYSYGRSPRKARKNASDADGTGHRFAPMSEWKVLLLDRVPAYITWERYLANQQRLQQNRSLPRSPGTPRNGAALLVGLIVCGTCGRRMHASYPARTKPQYTCERHLKEAREQTCHSVSAAAIDELVAAQVLRALEPAALELSLKAIADIEQDRARLHRHWKQKLERARYEAQRAERQYQATEPENRLVARTLERRWEEALNTQRQLEEEYDRFAREELRQLGTEERARILALSRDIPALWNAPATTAADRKEIVRHLVEKVVVHVQFDSEYVDIMIHWQGGFTSQHEVVRPVLRFEQLRGYEQLKDRIVRCRGAGDTAVQIAAKLNSDGFRTPKSKKEYTKDSVQKLIARFGLVNEKATDGELGPNEWWLADLSRELDVNEGKLRSWAVRGWLYARRTPKLGLWIAWADGQERRRLTQLKEHSRRGVRHLPELTTPKPRAKGR
jgi:DNA invertase Pin-like site-specific DNA recombinase